MAGDEVWEVLGTWPQNARTEPIPSGSPWGLEQRRGLAVLTSPSGPVDGAWSGWAPARKALKRSKSKAWRLDQGAGPGGQEHRLRLRLWVEAACSADRQRWRPVEQESGQGPPGSLGGCVLRERTVEGTVGLGIRSRV